MGAEFEGGGKSDASASEIEGLKKQVEALTQEKKILKTQTKQITTSLQTSQASASQHDETKAALDSTVSNLEGVQKENDAMKIQIGILNSSLEDVHATSAMADTDLQLKIEEYLEEIGTLKEQVEGVRKEEKLKAAKEWGARLKGSKEEFERKLKEVVGGRGGGKEVETLKAQVS